MLKIIFISSLFMLVVSWMPGQTGQSDLQKQLDELKTRIKNLEKENENLRSEDKSYDSAVYCSMRSDIFSAFSNISQLDFDFKNTADKIAVTGLFAKLIQASNPTSDVLGFRFTDVMMKAVERHFLDALNDEQDKKRFSQVICKIVDNPVVSSLANTNPVTSVVAAIINTIAGFSTSHAELEKEGGRIKDVSIDQQDAFDNRSIKAFRDELQAYIDFYDAMIIASTEYIKELDNMSIKYTYLMRNVKEYKAELFTELEIKESNIILILSNLLPDPALKNIDYDSLLKDTLIIKSLAISRKYPALQQSVDELIREYNLLLFNFLTDYIHILETTKNFPDHDIDKTKAEKLILDIESFIETQKINEIKMTGLFK